MEVKDQGTRGTSEGCREHCRVLHYVTWVNGYPRLYRERSFTKSHLPFIYQGRSCLGIFLDFSWWIAKSFRGINFRNVHGSIGEVRAACANRRNRHTFFPYVSYDDYSGFHPPGGSVKVYVHGPRSGLDVCLLIGGSMAGSPIVA